MSNPIKLKVCGMRDPANILAVGAVKPDYMGFIFYPNSPRDVSYSFRLPENFPAGIKKVGVFVNDGVDTIAAQVKKLSLDYVQLHSTDDSLRFCEEVYFSGIRVIKAFSVDDNFDFELTKPFKKIANYFLFDTKGKRPGGNGKTFDWRILERYDQEVPFFLSGGLNPENLSDLTMLKGMNIHALDINSGVEISPAMKDVQKIKQVQEILSTLK